MHLQYYVLFFSYFLLITTAFANSGEEGKFDALIRRIESVEQENAKLRTEVGALKQELRHPLRKRQERPPAIGFTAYISHHLSSLGHQHTILFDKTKSNYGNGYDNLTGVFIAPQEGVYVFFSNIMSEQSSDLTYIETEIVKNGDQLAEMYSGAQQAFDSSSNMAVTKLNKGDHVWVRVHGSWSNNFSIHCCFSTFSGFLIGDYFMDENIVGK